MTALTPVNDNVLQIDGPSPNVNSGLPYANSPGTGPFTDQGVLADQSGTGPGLPPGGIAATTTPNLTVQTVPATRTAEGSDSSAPGIDSGLPGAYPTTVVGPSTAAVPADSST
jgi:hypothetical protein